MSDIKEKKVDGHEPDVGNTEDFSEGLYRLGRESGNLYRAAGASEREVKRKTAEVIRFLEGAE